MRNLKYRVWHKYLKEMFTVAHLHFGIDGLTKVETGSTLSDTWTLDDIELMQFTGLQDCTGKDIYEGDIIRTDNEQDGDEPSVDHYFGVVTYDDQRTGYFIQQPHDKYSPALHNYYIASIEVVGNVYENHELIQERQP